MTDRDPARPDYEQLADDLPKHVIDAVADAVSPQEIGATRSAISELVHRIMVVTYQAANPIGTTAFELRRQAAFYESVIERRGASRGVQTGNKAFALVARQLRDRAADLDGGAA